jgi:putative ABC transport system permease protein
MQVRPILSAMMRNKVAPSLIAAQIAITLAVLCNALFIIQQRLSLSRRPTGTDEANVFYISNQWVGLNGDLDALARGDIAALRAVPGVIDAFISNAYPLANGGWGDGVSLTPGQAHATAMSAIYFADEHGLNTLGVHLVAGRNFEPAEIRDFHVNELAPPASAIVTRDLAAKLYPRGSALGQTLYLPSLKSTIPIVGIVDRMQVPWVSGGGPRYDNDSMFLPFHFIALYSQYLIRAKPGQLLAVMHDVEKKLYEISRNRVLERVESLPDARVRAYRDDRGLALILSVVCGVLLAVTAFGIVGVTSHWVSQRQRQIGIRRALGATRFGIVRYFQVENLLISGTGAATGIGLALLVNLWMVRRFEMQRLHMEYTVIGAVILLALGQAAVLWPALRAASISPASAARI